MENKSLYQIDIELQQIVDELIDNGGELTPELEEALKISQDNLAIKLDNYRKVVSELQNKVDYCKQEATRISVLKKSREGIVNRLKNSMLEAVLKWGNANKSGNKVIDLPDSKLLTRKSICCETDDNLIQILIDSALDRFRELWNCNMLLESDELDNIDLSSFINTVNANFEAENPEYAAQLLKDKGHLFREEDFESTKVKFEIELPLNKLCNKLNYDVLNMYFNHEHEASRIINSSVSDYKQYITSREVDLSVATLCDSYSLNIK